jgi:hypothetical protein
MGDIDIKYTILEKENKEGLYLVDFDKNTYIAYIEDINAIKNTDEPIANSEDLKKMGVYLLEDIEKVLNYSEEKTKKIIRYLYRKNKDIVKFKSFKVFILLLETYIIYHQIFLSAAVKNPTLIDFFENNDNKIKIKIEIMKRLFNYLVSIKMLDTKLETSKLENILDNLFEIIDSHMSTSDSNGEIIDSTEIYISFLDVAEKLSSIQYENFIHIISVLNNINIPIDKILSRQNINKDSKIQ